MSGPGIIGEGQGTGTSGGGAVVTTAASFTQPNQGSTVTTSFTSTGDFYVTKSIQITGGGLYQVTAVNADGIHATIQNMNGLSAVAPGVTVNSGADVAQGPPFRWVPGDANTVHQWLLQESSGPFLDIGTGGNNLSVLAGVSAISPGPFATCVDSARPGNTTGTLGLTGGAGSAAIAVPITLSAWLFNNYDGGGGSPSGGNWLGRSNDTTNDVGNESLALWTNVNLLSARFRIVAASNPVDVTVSIWPGFGESSGASAGNNCNTWNHVGVTYDGAHITLYWNGVLAKQVAQTGAIIWNTANPWWLFGRAASGDAAPVSTTWAGRLADVRIESVARNLTYFQQVYRSWTGTF